MRSLYELVHQKLAKVHSDIYMKVVPDGLYILAGINIISYFRSAGNRVNATAVAINFISVST